MKKEWDERNVKDDRKRKEDENDESGARKSRPAGNSLFNYTFVSFSKIGYKSKSIV